MRKIKVVKFIYFLFIGFFTVLSLSFANLKNIKYLLAVYFPRESLAYTYTTPRVKTPQGVVQPEYKIYDLSGGYFTVPTKGTRDYNQDFPGYTIYEYYYPSNPELNNDERPKRIQFKKDGSVETYNNFAIKGYRTQLINDYDNNAMGFGSYEIQNGKDVNYRRFMTMYPRSFDAELNGNAIMNNSWNGNDNSGLGPSVFFNANHSKFDFINKTGKPYFISDTRKSKIIENNFNPDEYVWLEYLDDGSSDFQIQNASAFDYKDPYFFITDLGNRRIVKYSRDPVEFSYLGRKDWNWRLQGIAVDDNAGEQGGATIYVADGAQNTIIKTKIDGSGWQESHTSMDNYSSRLFLNGSEYFNVYGASGGQATGADLQDCGFTRHKAWIESQSGVISYNAAQKRVAMQDSEHPLFGKESLHFNGQETLVMPDHSAWNFGNDYFAIDFWIRFDRTDITQSLVSVPDSFIFEYYRDTNTSSLNFALIKNEIGTNGQRTYHEFKYHWEPEIGVWYHIAVLRLPGNILRMTVDGVPVDHDQNITGTIVNGESNLNIGAYAVNGGYTKFFYGNMDNFRIIQGLAYWATDFSYQYEFYDPHGMEIVGDYVYVADTGNNRIVKISKDFKHWWTFGNKGSGQYQFNSPTDIYYSDGVFYIVDSGNNRVIRTDMAKMAWMFKEDFSGSSWEVIYQGNGRRLYAVAAKGTDVAVTDIENAQIILNGEAYGGKNPWYGYLKYTFPLDVLPAEEDKWFFLDAVSDMDFSINSAVRATEFYGTNQEEDIMVRFNNGGLIASPYLFTEGVIAKLNYDDYQRWTTEGHRLSHCPEILEHDPARNFGGRCDAWGIYEDGFDYGYTYKSANVDCNRAAAAGVVPPSECVGQWDWNLYWPYCNTLKPAFSRRTADAAEVAAHCCTGSGCCRGSGDPKCFEHSTCVAPLTVCEAWCEPVAHDCFLGWSVNFLPFDSSDYFGRQVYLNSLGD